MARVRLVIAILASALPAAAQVKVVAPATNALPAVYAQSLAPSAIQAPPGAPAAQVATGLAPLVPIAYAGPVRRHAASQPVAGAVARTLRQAGAAEASPEHSLRALTEIFDGLAPNRRERVLAELESTVRAAPKDVALRHALQGLVLRDELSIVEPKLRGLPLTEGRRDAVLAKTEFHDIRWWDYLIGRVAHPEAYGVAKPADLSIHLHIHRGWRSMPSLIQHVRAVFSHEYTHRLQFEKEATTAYGAEIPAIATEMLRAVELAGVDALGGGTFAGIGKRLVDRFDEGMKWMSMASHEGPIPTTLYFEGFLAGASYELARLSGRWADAWTYHRRVSHGEDPLAVRRELLAAPQYSASSGRS